MEEGNCQRGGGEREDFGMWVRRCCWMEGGGRLDGCSFFLALLVSRA